MTLCLNSAYSTTRIATREKPEVLNSPKEKYKTILFLPENSERQGEGGLRTKGYFKKSYDNKPLVSIITVVYNGEEFIDATIQSVINQTYDNVEYIFIDGGSTDGTLDIIKRYEDRIDYWVSEKDAGIYDAMNKAITITSGDWVNFMNAGDTFYNNNTLKNLFKVSNFNDINILYGHHEVRYPHKKRIARAGNIADIWKASQFSHQSVFISSRYHKMHPYNTCIKITADFAFFYNAYVNNAKFQYKDDVISSITSGGVSDIKRVDGILEMWMVQEKSNKVNFYYIFRILKEMLKEKVKKRLSAFSIQKEGL